MKMYGPYTRKDGRKHVVIIHDDGRRQTKSWPRVLMERKLGRELLPNEEVDHIDHDFTNDDLDNLQILTKLENALKEMTRIERQRKLHTFICPSCDKEATKFLNNVLGNLKKGRNGPYCSRSCAGKARHSQ